MSDVAGHTTLPWVVKGEFCQVETPQGGLIATVYDGAPTVETDSDIADANAAFIVQACNSFYAMREALKDAPDFGGEPKTAFGREYREWQVRARAAIAGSGKI